MVESIGSEGAAIDACRSGREEAGEDHGIRTCVPSYDEVRSLLVNLILEP